MHKNAVEVQAASQMSMNGKNRAFTKLKRKGIAKYNSCHAGLQDGEVLRERQSSFPYTVVACGKCSGVFSKAHFWRHKRVLTTALLPVTTQQMSLVKPIWILLK